VFFDVINSLLGQRQLPTELTKVYAVEDSLPDNYNSDVYTQAAADLCRKVLPFNYASRPHPTSVVILAPRLNGRLGGGLAMDAWLIH